MEIEFTLNSIPVKLDIDPSKRLLDILRDDLKIKSLKEGCGEGECGACSVIINGDLAASCITAAFSISGKQIITLEGVRNTELYDCIEDSFALFSASQCGFCTPGMILATYCAIKKLENLENMVAPETEFDNNFDINKKDDFLLNLNCGNKIEDFKSLLKPDHKDLLLQYFKKSIEGNLCRCTGYTQIVEAMYDAFFCYLSDNE